MYEVRTICICYVYIFLMLMYLMCIDFAVCTNYIKQKITIPRSSECCGGEAVIKKI